MGLVGGKTKNASCSELGDEKASYGEVRSLPGVWRPYICWWLPGRWVASYDPRGRMRQDRLLSITPERFLTCFAQLATGCSNPACISVLPVLTFLLPQKLSTLFAATGAAHLLCCHENCLPQSTAPVSETSKAGKLEHLWYSHSNSTVL